MAKDYSVLDELTPKTVELHRAIFDKGYEQGVNDGSLDVKMRVEGAYEKSLNDAWDCAKKIVCDKSQNGYSLYTLKEIFGTTSISDIFSNFSPSEAITRIKEYEEKQKQADNEIKVGDEVYIVMENYPSVVTCIFSENGLDSPKAVHITQSGRYTVTPLSQLHKTGRHFDQIAEVLEQLKE